MSEAVDVEHLTELGDLVEDITTTGQSVLDVGQMKKLKKVCKKSDLYVDHTFHIVMTQMKKAHAEIRLSCFQIIDELFTRSHKFRELLLDEFQVFLELALGTNCDDPLPPPANVAKVLKEKTVYAIASWQQKYGSYYKKLDLGYNYLKRIKHINFDAIRERATTEQRRSEDKERRRQAALLKKLGNVELEMTEQTGHMQLCVTEINNCFNLLLPHPDDYEVHLDNGDDDEKVLSSPLSGTEEGKAETLSEKGSQSCKNVEGSENESNCNSEADDEKDSTENALGDNENSDDFLTRHGLGSRSYHIDIELSKMKPIIHETEDNTDILDTARDMYKEICHKYMPMVNKWLTVLSKAGQPQQRIQNIIDLKQELQKASGKFQELNINPLKRHTSETDAYVSNTGNENSDDEFEDVPEKEGLEIIPAHKRAEYGLEPLEDARKGSPGSGKSRNSSPVSMDYKEKLDQETFLKTSGFSMKDAEDPTSLARALLESRRQYLNSQPSTSKEPSNEHLPQPKQFATTRREIENSERKNKLLEIAPVVPFDRDLYYWENPDFEAPKIIKSENFNNVWAYKDVDEEQVLGDNKGSMLRRKIAFGGKFEPVKWSCRAPLSNGKLCPRKDRIKCPFHGKVIARDEHGNPSEIAQITGTSSSTSTASTSAETSEPAWRQIQPEIEAATGIDLGGKGKRRKARAENDDKELSKKQKYARLTDLNKKTKTARSRLEDKVMSKAAVKRVTAAMDSQATKIVQDKFGDQFNYALH